MHYRREIDGLRAVAVIPVILFHAGFTIFSGGFVGVDIFFVISGYLITSIILAECRDGRFSIIRFYERRARRILPALTVVVLACIPFAWMWMLPDQLRDFSQSIVAVALFASNILFWRQSGYFDPVAEEKPLLHTWSLAVEEQYYMLFPLFVFLMWRFGRRPLFSAIVLIAGVSLILSEIGFRTVPTANFYLAPTRAWELLAGSLCALAQFGGTQKKNDLLAGLGLGLIVFSIFVYNDATPFPSLYALAPVGGAALIILYGSKGTWVARLLSMRGFVGIGLISYSAYLWHQPLFAFARIHSLHHPTPTLMAALGALSLVLAYLSWRFIEQPFRRKEMRLLPGAPKMLTAAAAVTALFIAVGLSGHIARGFPDRLPQDVLALAKAQSDGNPLRGNCHYSEFLHQVNVPDLPAKPCIVGKDKAHIKVALLGDSHASAIAWPILNTLADDGLTATQITVTDCQPFLGYTKGSLDCHAVNGKIQDYVLNSDIDVVILAARWASTYYDAHYDNGEGGVEDGNFGAKSFMADYVSPASKSRGEKAIDIWQRGLKRYLDAGKKVILVYPIPESGWNVPGTLAKAAMLDHRMKSLSTSYTRYQQRYGPVIAAFDAIRDPNLFRIKPADALCDSFIKGRCANAIDDKVFYYDDDHLSLTGAALFAPDVAHLAERLVRETSVADTIGRDLHPTFEFAASVIDRPATTQDVH